MVKNLPAMQETWVRSLCFLLQIPWRRKWLPTWVFSPGEFHGQRSLAGYSPDTINQLISLPHTYSLPPRPRPHHTQTYIHSQAFKKSWLIKPPLGHLDMFLTPSPYSPHPRILPGLRSQQEMCLIWFHKAWIICYLCVWEKWRHSLNIE